MSTRSTKGSKNPYRYEMRVASSTGANWNDHKIAKYRPRGQKKPAGLPFALVRYKDQREAMTRIMRANPGAMVFIVWPVGPHGALGPQATKRPNLRGAARSR